MIATRPLTVVAPIAGGAAGARALRDRLRLVRDDLTGKHGRNPGFHPADLPDTHFMRLVIVDDAHGDQALAPVLAWEVNHDGTTEAYLRAVAAAAVRPGAALDLDGVFGACEGYPAGGVRDADGFVTWMRAHAIRTEAFYCGYRDASKRRVDNDRKVHAAIRSFLDRERATLVALPPATIHARIAEHLATTGLDLSPADDGEAGRRTRNLLRYAPVALLLPLAPVLLLLAAILWWRLRQLERTDKPEDIIRPVHADEDLIRAEDHIVQNQLTHLAEIKPGLTRWIALRTVLYVIDALAGIHYVHGHLGGITSIHFARWVILKDPRSRRARAGQRARHRLLFFSNYDFSWDSYLGEFIDRAASGLTAVWSHTEGFPRTRRLTEEGARDEERFKQWTRSRQLPTDVWWSGVPDATVDNVRSDLRIREGVAVRPDYEELTRWLTRL